MLEWSHKPQTSKAIRAVEGNKDRLLQLVGLKKGWMVVGSVLFGGGSGFITPGRFKQLAQYAGEHLSFLRIAVASHQTGKPPQKK